MASWGKGRSPREVLRYTMTVASRATVLRHYLRWRKQQDPPLPLRCDNPECFFHTKPLMWNAKPFKPILDHIDGNNTDNSPQMLRLLCPNCDSQLATRGGGNKGRIEKSEGGFAKVSRDGRRAYVLPAEAAICSVSGHDAQFTVSSPNASQREDAQPVVAPDPRKRRSRAAREGR